MIISSPENIFGALSDPTRQQLIDWMVAGETGTATEFAAGLPISRQAVARHLSELAKACLAKGVRRGKEVRYSLDPGSLPDAMRMQTGQRGYHIEAVVPCGPLAGVFRSPP